MHLARVFKLIHFRVRNISYRPVAKEDRIQHKLVRGSLGPDENGKRPDGMVDALIEPVCHLQEKNGTAAESAIKRKRRNCLRGLRKRE